MKRSLLAAETPAGRRPARDPAGRCSPCPSRGILVVVTCALSFLLLLVALPPVILLQRSLMHQQLAAAARIPRRGC